MSDDALLVDTSVAVALVVLGHEAHQRTIESLEGFLLGLAGHAWFETFSVLTRLPTPLRRSPTEVAEILEHNFPESRFLTTEASKDLARRLAGIGVSGGAVYDALVGAVATAHRMRLATRDRRALDLYRALGADILLLS